MKRVLLSLFLLTTLGFVSGCGDDNDDNAPSARAQVRVAHLSPDAPAVDVRVDGSKVLTNVPFKAVSDYLELSGGSHTVTVTPFNATTPVVINATVTVTAGKSYTVAAVGQLGNGTLQPLVLEDDRSPTADKSKVRFVHASPDAPAVDVVVVSGPTLFPNQAFKSASGYAAVPQGTYDLAVQLTGTTTVALNVPGVSLSQGYNYTVFAVGLAGAGTLEALPVLDYQP